MCRRSLQVQVLICLYSLAACHTTSDHESNIQEYSSPEYKTEETKHFTQYDTEDVGNSELHNPVDDTYAAESAGTVYPSRRRHMKITHNYRPHYMQYQRQLHSNGLSSSPSIKNHNLQTSQSYQLFNPNPDIKYTDFPHFYKYFNEQQSVNELSNYMQNGYQYGNINVETPKVNKVKKFKGPIHKRKIIQNIMIIRKVRQVPNKPKIIQPIRIKYNQPQTQSHLPKLQNEHNAAFDEFVNSNYKPIENMGFNIVIGKPTENENAPPPTVYQNTDTRYRQESPNIQSYVDDSHLQVQPQSINTNNNWKPTFTPTVQNTQPKFEPSYVNNQPNHELTYDKVIEETKPYHQLKGYSKFVTPNVNFSYNYETIPNNNNNKSNNPAVVTSSVSQEPNYHTQNAFKYQDTHISSKLQTKTPQNGFQRSAY